MYIYLFSFKETQVVLVFTLKQEQNLVPFWTSSHLIHLSSSQDPAISTFCKKKAFSSLQINNKKALSFIKRTPIQLHLVPLWTSSHLIHLSSSQDPAISTFCKKAFSALQINKKALSFIKRTLIQLHLVPFWTSSHLIYLSSSQDPAISTICKKAFLALQINKKASSFIKRTLIQLHLVPFWTSSHLIHLSSSQDPAISTFCKKLFQLCK